MNYGEPKGCEVPLHEQIRQERAALCGIGMVPLITDESAQRCAEVAVTPQADYDRLLESYHVANRLARELRVALDAARKETTDLATRCADLENERDSTKRAVQAFALARDAAYQNVRHERDHWRNCHESLLAEYQSKLPPGILPDAYEAKQLRPHSSDCAVHNGPAYPPGPCSCGAYEPEPELPYKSPSGYMMALLRETEKAKEKIASDTAFLTDGQTVWPLNEPEPEQRLPAIPAAAASQVRPDPANPAPALPLNALLHGPKGTLR